MAGTEVIPAQGTTLVVGGVTITRLTSAVGPSGSRTEEDITTMASTEVDTRLGLLDGGDASAETLYEPGQDALKAMAEAQPAVLQACTLSGVGASITFNAYVKSFVVKMDADKSWRGSLSLRVAPAVAA